MIASTDGKPKIKVERTCPVCGITYQADPQRLKIGRQVYCSRRCSYIGRYWHHKGRITLACSACGKEFTRTRSQVKSKHKGVYCSRACHYAGRGLGTTLRVVAVPYQVDDSPAMHARRRESAARAAATRKKNGYRHSEATREKFRMATAKRIADGTVPAVSGVEDKVAEELAARGVVFIRQYIFRDPVSGRFAGLADFYLPQAHTVIEVNGTFWHADPRIYDGSNLKPAQRRTLERYQRKVQFYRKAGVWLIELWEADLRKGFPEALFGPRVIA